MKIVYRVLVFVFVLCGSVMFFSRFMSEKTVAEEEAIAMGNAQLPLLSVNTGDDRINRMYGYSTNLNADSLRDSMTLMREDMVLDIWIDECESSVRKLAYELRSLDEDSLLDSGSILALETDEATGQKTAHIKFKGELISGREYTLKMMVVTQESRKIYYYTRIKYYETDPLFQEKLAFVKEIHDLAWSKDKKQELTPYLETNTSMENDSLANVNIHSSHDLVCWGSLKPKLISEIIPTLKEINIETAAFELAYRVEAKTASGKEKFTVREFFRVKYANGRKYLLYYQRTMEADFDIELTSLAKSELKIGVTNDKDMQLVTDENGSRVAFVRNGELWYYNIAANQAVLVFSFRSDGSEDVRELYDQHDIRILTMDQDGVMDFLVYGYMNRGSYEGRTGILLYRFYPERECVEERVYIPFESPFERMKYDLDEFSYVSGNDVFYFSINNVVYAYNIHSGELEVLAEGIRADNIYLSTEGSFIAWQNSSNPKKAVKITVLDLETEVRNTIRVKKGKCLTLLGGIQNKMIYGIMNKRDIAEASDGTIVTPMYEVRIVDTAGETIKRYDAGKYYVTGVKIKDSIITLYRAKQHKQSSSLYYSSYTPDHIINNQEEKKIYVHMTSRVTDAALTEQYISLTQGYVLEELPTVARAGITVLHKDTTLRLDMSSMKSDKYYVYALGDVIEADTQTADAVAAADLAMGVVLDEYGKIVWERGAKYNHNAIEGIPVIRTGSGVTSKGACLSMLLAAANVEVEAEKLSNSTKSVYSLFKKYSAKTPLKLTGCSLDAVLYYVSSGRPVIGMKSASEAVLITEYDEYSITVIDPALGKRVTYSMERAQKMFEHADNVFVSYY